MAPRWKRGGSKGLWGFESPSLRSQFQITDLLIRDSCQAPASVQSRTHEPRQDRKVATVVLFRCAAVVTGACPISTVIKRNSLFRVTATIMVWCYLKEAIELN